MEQSKHSEEEILKLGEKLVKELNLEYSNKIMDRWLAHYLSELMFKAKNSKSDEEKERYKKESCEIILKLWGNKDVLPIQTPLKNLKVIEEVLEVFRDKEEVLVLPRWLGSNFSYKENKWAKFVDVIKNNSERIIDLSLGLVLNDDIILKDKEWLNEHGNMLSDEEKKIISLLDMVIEVRENSVIDAGDIEHKSKEQKIKFIIEEFEKLLEEQVSGLRDLKRSLDIN